MKKIILIFVSSILLFQFVAANSVADLKLEFKVNPQGIAEINPRFSWINSAHDKSEYQTAYQILVSSSTENLNKNIADVWNSGIVKDDNSFSIIYNGPKLISEKQYYWKVKTWDRRKNPSEWSETANWSMGLLNQSDWKAKWIGCDTIRGEVKDIGRKSAWKNASWIWHNADGTDPKVCTRYFRRKFTINNLSEIDSVFLNITADDKFIVYVNNKFIGETPMGKDWNNIYSFSVKKLLVIGENDILIQVDNVTSGPAGVLAKIEAYNKDQLLYRVLTDNQWESSTGKLASDKWEKVGILGAYGIAPWGIISGDYPLYLPPVTYLRKTFNANSHIKRAIVYASAQGLYKLYINGNVISSDLLTPGWTDYNKRIYYQTYDVTDKIREGKNAFGAILADGWFSGYIGFYGKRNFYGTNPRLLTQLHIEYDDGSSTLVDTDDTWKASTGPLIESDMLKGEAYDAQLEMPDWSKSMFDDSKWYSVNVGSEINPILESHPGEPVRVFKEIKPVKMTMPKAGNYVFNMGQNFAGVVRLKIKGEAGQKIVLRFAERLNSDGTIYTTNLRTARTTDTYICKGGEEIWTPMFTFHGFQYVEITGLTVPPQNDIITGLAFSSNTENIGSFECSNEMLNELYSNIYWTQKMNFIDIPTDCPQRDERLGWTGDAQVYIRTATLISDVHSFFNKWLVDLNDEQLSDGQYPCTAPLKFFGGGGAGWADAGIICPYNISTVYNDKRIVQKFYPQMEKFMLYCKSQVNADFSPKSTDGSIGDWLNVNDETPKDLIFMAYYANSANLMAKMAKMIERDEDAIKYHEIFLSINKAFERIYISSDGVIKGNTQCAYVLPIAFNMLDSVAQSHAADHLVQLIKNRDWHLSTGFLGTKDLMMVLAKIGRNDVAYKLALNDTYPSWGFSIKNGATSIWERWDGWTPEKGFQDPTMNSFAHYSFGAVYHWMFENIGGIRMIESGYKKFIVDPIPGGGLDSANVTFTSVYGLIQSKWKKDGKLMRMNITIPVGSKALVYVPALSLNDVSESGKIIKRNENIKYLRIENGKAVFEVGSGTYLFTGLWNSLNNIN